MNKKAYSIEEFYLQLNSTVRSIQLSSDNRLIYTVDKSTNILVGQLDQRRVKSRIQTKRQYIREIQQVRSVLIIVELQNLLVYCLKTRRLLRRFSFQTNSDQYYLKQTNVFRLKEDGITTTVNSDIVQVYYLFNGITEQKELGRASWIQDLDYDQGDELIGFRLDAYSLTVFNARTFNLYQFQLHDTITAYCSEKESMILSLWNGVDHIIKVYDYKLKNFRPQRFINPTMIKKLYACQKFIVSHSENNIIVWDRISTDRVLEYNGSRVKNFTIQNNGSHLAYTISSDDYSINSQVYILKITS